LQYALLTTDRKSNVIQELIKKAEAVEDVLAHEKNPRSKKKSRSVFGLKK
jgi:hypothetical protein